MKFSKVIVWAVVGLAILFTVAVLFVFAKTGNEPAALVVAVFGFLGHELWQLAGIKKSRIKKEGE